MIEFLNKIENYITKENKEQMLLIEKMISEIYFLCSKSSDNLKTIKSYLMDKEQKLDRLSEENFNFLKKIYLEERHGENGVIINDILNINYLYGRDNLSSFPDKSFHITYSFKFNNSNSFEIVKNKDNSEKNFFAYTCEQLGLVLINDCNVSEDLLIFDRYEKKRNFLFFKVKKAKKRFNIRESIKSTLNYKNFIFILNNLKLDASEIKEQLELQNDISLFEVEHSLISDMKYINQTINECLNEKI